MAASTFVVRQFWLVVLFCALALLCWENAQRAARATYVTDTDAEARVVDPASASGYANGKRWFIAGERNNRSYQWISETEQMFARGEWRVRRVDNENAPIGRAVFSASPYRWWLGAIAKLEQARTGLPLPNCVERAAHIADPALHILILAAAAIFVWRHWGAAAASGFSLLGATLFPLAAAYIPSAPDDHGLSWLCGLWTLLPLLAAAYSPEQYTPEAARPRRTNLLVILSAIAAAFGLWVNAVQELAFLAGIFLGGIFCEFVGRRKPDATPFLPWRTWALVGALVSLVFYLLEYFPGYLELRPLTNHPLYALAWIGAGELLAQIQAARGDDKASGRLIRVARVAAAIAAVAALPAVILWKEKSGVFQIDEYSARLTFLPNGVVAKNLFHWIARDGVTRSLLATVAPLVFVVWGTFAFLSTSSDSLPRRRALALGAGPALLLLLYACFHLRQWCALDAVLLALVPALASAPKSAEKTLSAKWSRFAIPGIVSIFGLLVLFPKPFRATETAFTVLEVQSLMERQAAHWIADHSETKHPIVLLPPDRTTSWCFHGGLRGVGTANWENRDGVAATVRIAVATSAEEAQGLITQRGINFIALPSWDGDLDAFARWARSNPEDAFIMALHHWSLPPWLQAVPYRLPEVPGFENESIVMLKVTDETNRVTALARLAEYFVESEKRNEAASIKETLRKYPTDLNALIATAAIERFQGASADAAETVDAIVASLNAGADRSLAWDRRVSLSVVLAQAGRTELAQQQTQRCLDRLNEQRIRTLTTGSLYRLQALAKAFNIPIADPRLRALAADLLPKPLRERL
ncbi:MAG TPA: hypothetical protein VFT72_12670 [Opitutaceae bacterium]|nr:hypothetical protein [Opitutaceae bacterium]